MGIRKNASLEAVAEKAHYKALRALEAWRKQRAYIDRQGRIGHVDFHERVRESGQWLHYSDLKEIAEHLARLSKTEAEYAKREAEWEAVQTRKAEREAAAVA